MPKRCVAAGCSNTYKNNVSLFLFPKDTDLRSKWTKQVKRTRAEWSGPSDYNVLCSNHFDESCFEPDTELASQMGIKKRVRLTANAVPTLFSRTEPEPGPSTPHCRKRTPSHLPSHRSTKRSAFEKRERQSIVTDLLTHNDETGGLSEIASVTVEPDIPTTIACNASTQAVPDRKNVGVQIRRRTRTHGVQVAQQTSTIGIQCILPEVKTVGVQCSLPQTGCDGPSLEPSNDKYLSASPVSSYAQSDTTPSDLPGDTELDTSGFIAEDDTLSDECATSNPSPESRSCYLVFESALLLFFAACRFCSSKNVDIKKFVIGSFLQIRQTCQMCRKKWIWNSQPKYGDVPAGNISLSAAILYAGALPSKILRMFSILNCSVISIRTFHRHQTQYLLPCISSTWAQHQSALMSTFKEDKKELLLSGDGRSDSPGHSTKYGSYSVIEMSCSKVIDYKLVQSNEVGGSYHMEKEGLQRVLNYLEKHGLVTKVLVTDRHPQINKWLRENYPSIKHYYDIWHVAKGFRKKLQAVAKQSNCELIGKWQRSVVNHLYWCVSSTLDGDTDMVIAKWLSLENHVHNKHSHMSPKFNKCAHGRLRTRKKKWFKRHTKASEKLTSLLTNTRLCNDIRRLSPLYQTSSLEAYHSVIIHFAPKYVPFSYHGMNCRLALAALHFNENSGRGQAVTSSGIKRYNLLFPKYKKGGHIVRKVLVSPSYNYTQTLMDKTINLCTTGYSTPLPSADTPAPLSVQYERPDKSIAISAHKSRFGL